MLAATSPTSQDPRQSRSPIKRPLSPSYAHPSSSPFTSSSALPAKKSPSAASSRQPLILLPPRWTYFHLSPLYNPTIPTPNSIPSSTPFPLPTIDAPTLRLHLLYALSSHLGDHGAAIPVDILSITSSSTPPSSISTSTTSAYLRVPLQDGHAFAAALASYVGGKGGGGGGEGSRHRDAIVGFRVRGRSEWLASLIGAGELGGCGGQDLFDFSSG